ncbi:ribonuclease H-like domain-containing protein [Tanacetum coccineum]|uniref:Ribonuclease H-like domain-containing protein n=1 Tax=Tanacetum coccineum TaxID=301880 RepID=A0ABQ5CDY6_9ASTR
MSGSQDEIPPPPPPPSSQTPTQQTPHTVSTIKLPILKKGEYDIWAMKMEHYLAHTDYPIWEIIQNGNEPVSIITDTQGQIKVLPPRTAEEILAKERERKARTTLLMALPEDHLAKFHQMTDAKEMWDAIKSRLGGNDESKKMFQSLLSQLEIHGASVSIEDANQKFLRSIPSAWSQVSLIMRAKPGVDSLGFDDLYNNLRVFENDVKGSTTSPSSTQNVAFVSENTISTNDVSTAYGVSNPSGHNSQYEQTSSYSLLANQSSCPQLDHEDLEQLDEFDLEEMDLKWQVAMISMRMKKFYKKTGRKLQFDAKEPVGFDKTKVECYNCHKTGHFTRECRTKGNQDSKRRDAWNSGNKDGRRSGKQEDSKALVTIDGEGVDWTSHSEEEEDYALMACNSSDTEVTSCSKECKESYAKLKKLYDEQRAQLSDASIEIQAYTQGLKKVEAQLVAHQQGQLWYEEKIRFMKIDLDDKTDVLTYHKKLLAEAQKEKEDLKAKVEKWHNSSKNLGKLLNTQMSANDKFGLGYGDHRYDGILSYENEVLQSVFMNKESELVNQPLYDRFVTAGGMHVVPPPMTGNYMPSGPDVEIDYSQFTYGPKQSQPNCSVETHEPLPEPTINEPKVVSQPKVWSDAPIIEEYASDNEDEHVRHPIKKHEQPSFASTNKQVKTPRETVKNQFTHSKSPTVEKRMAKQAELNNNMRMKSSQREIRTEFGTRAKESALQEQKDLMGALLLLEESKGYHNWGGSIHKAPVMANRSKGIKREYSNARTPQQNGVAERKNRTLIEAARTMLADSFLLNTFWAEAIRESRTKTCRVHRSIHTAVKRSTAKDASEAPNYHLDLKTDEKPVDEEDQVFLDELERLKRQEKDANNATEALRKEFAQETENLLLQAGAAKTSSTNIVNTVSTPISTASPYGGLSFTDSTNPKQDDSEIPALEDIYQNLTDGIFIDSSYDDEGAVADFTNLEPIVNVSPIPTLRINSIHPSTLILGDPQSEVQTRSKVPKSSGAHAFVSYVQKQRRNNHKDFQHCLFVCFLSQNEPKKISEALEDESWVDVMQEELLQFKIQKVWILVDLPYGKKAIGTK